MGARRPPARTYRDSTTQVGIVKPGLADPVTLEAKNAKGSI